MGFIGGPGESQIELDRRRIDERIDRIKRELEAVKRTRGLHRQARRRVPYPVIALVGYTNAGKSTLFNRLTGATVGARDQLFATLDPTMRELALPSGRHAILSDTVGFIAQLPTNLIAAFRATLEEVRSADLVIHVRDIAHPESAAQRADVLEVLRDLGLEHLVDEGRLVELWNKVDLLSADEAARMAEAAARLPEVVLGSARTGQGLDGLLAELDRRFASTARVVELDLDRQRRRRPRLAVSPRHRAEPQRPGRSHPPQGGSGARRSRAPERAIRGRRDRRTQPAKNPTSTVDTLPRGAYMPTGTRWTRVLTIIMARGSAGRVRAPFAICGTHGGVE